ncbi:MAG: hypothetical protein ACTTKL_07735 [Treponema sp.]
MKKIVLSICLLFSVAMAAVSEKSSQPYTKMTIAEYQNSRDMDKPDQVMFDGVYVMGIDYSLHSIPIWGFYGSLQFISFYDDADSVIGTYHSMPANQLRTVLKWQRQGTRLKIYVHKELTKRLEYILLLDWVEEE